MRRAARLLAVGVLTLMVAGCTALRPGQDVRYSPTPQHVVTAMLRLADVGPHDVLYDLGSGDGRIVVTAARDFGFGVDTSAASVVTLYLAEELNERLRPKLLRELRPGARVVSHRVAMGDWKPDREIVVQVDGQPRVVYLWIVPPRR